jgi:hypothetical protein
MSRPPDPPELPEPSTPAPPPISLARLLFGPDPPPSAVDLVLLRDAIHHAVVLAGAAPAPEVEGFLVALDHRAEATQDPQTRRVVWNRLQAIRADLPREIPLTAVVSVVSTLDPAVLRILGSLLAWLGSQIGRRTRAMHIAQRQLARHLSPPERIVVREAVARDLAELRRTRTLYRSTHRLIQRLAPRKRPAGLTAEAHVLFARFTHAGCSKRAARRWIAAVLRHWHGLPEAALTAEHIRARLQARPKPPR